MPGDPTITVRGGAGGIEAHYDDLRALARLFGQAATELAELSLQLHGQLLDPGLVAGGLLDPVGGFEFEAQLGTAVDGPGGITWLAARCGFSDVKLRAAALAYETEDFALSRIEPIARGVADLPMAVAFGAATYARTHSWSAAGQRIVTADPQLADDVVIASGGVQGALAGSLSTVVVDGPPLVRAIGIDPDEEAATPPHSLRELMQGLERRSNAKHGEIDVRILTAANGRRSVIVDIPGTKSWDPLPNGDITSLATNLRAVRGASTGYEKGVLLAMTRAGVRPDDKVMLVGHSQGGMIAVNAAVTARETGRFDVTHVVTAGSPIGVIAGRLPGDVEVLALENKHDVVPHTDGRSNPARPNVTTVTFDSDTAKIGDNHGWETSYVPGAGAVDRSSDPSITAFRGTADGFFNATEVTTQRFVITRNS